MYKTNIARIGWLMWRTICGVGVVALVLGVAVVLEDVEGFFK